MSTILLLKFVDGDEDIEGRILSNFNLAPASEPPRAPLVPHQTAVDAHTFHIPYSPIEIQASWKSYCKGKDVELRVIGIKRRLRKPSGGSQGP